MTHDHETRLRARLQVAYEEADNLRSVIATRDAEIARLKEQRDKWRGDGRDRLEDRATMLRRALAPLLAAEYERGKSAAAELHIRMLELRDVEAYRRGLLVAAMECSRNAEPHNTPETRGMRDILRCMAEHFESLASAAAAGTMGK